MDTSCSLVYSGSRVPEKESWDIKFKRQGGASRAGGMAGAEVLASLPRRPEFCVVLCIPFCSSGPPVLSQLYALLCLKVYS